MARFNSLVLILSLFSASNALASPHVARHHHRAIAARVAIPAPVDLPLVPLRKRQNSPRCKKRSSSAVNPPSSVPAASIPAAPATPVVVKPTSPTNPAPTTTPTPPPASTQAPAPAPKPTTTQAAQAGGSNNSNLPSFMVGTQTGQGTFYSSAFFFSLHLSFFFLTNARQLAWVHAVLRTKIPTTSPRLPTCYLTTSRAFQGSLFSAIKLLIVPFPSQWLRGWQPQQQSNVWQASNGHM